MGEVQRNWVKTEAVRTRDWLMLRVAGVGMDRWYPQLQASLLSTPLALRLWSLRPLWHWAWCVTCFGQWARCDETGSLGQKKDNASILPLSPFSETAMRRCPSQPENVPGLANWNDAEACACKRHEDVNPVVLRDQPLAGWYPVSEGGQPWSAEPLPSLQLTKDSCLSPAGTRSALLTHTCEQ